MLPPGQMLCDEINVPWVMNIVNLMIKNQLPVLHYIPRNQMPFSGHA
jgi:hypothetical protein